MRHAPERPPQAAHDTTEWPGTGHGQVVAEATRPQPGTAPCAAGASASLEELYRDYFQFVWRTVRRLGVAEPQIDDAVQDVFMVVHRQLPNYEPRRSVRSWLYSITRRVAADHRRAARRKGGHLPLREETVARSGDDPLRAAMDRERSDVVLAFLDSVDDLQREAFILCELEQLSAPEIADAVGASLSAVYSRIRSARQAFARYVRDHRPELMGDADG